MIEGLNRFLEEERVAKGVIVERSFFVLRKSSKPLKFGGLSKIIWEVHYTGTPQSVLIEISTTARVGRDDFNSDLSVDLQYEICKLVRSNKWEKIVNGEPI